MRRLVITPTWRFTSALLVGCALSGSPPDAVEDANVVTDANVADAAVAVDAHVATDASFPARGPVTINYTPLDQHGQYSPHNIGAAWIENSNGTFVKTLDVWALLVASRLVAWNAASLGNLVDAVTTASAREYAPRVATWDMTDVDHHPVADGEYTLKIEVTDHKPSGPVFSIPIHKGPDTVDTTFPDQDFLADIAVDYP